LRPATPTRERRREGISSCPAPFLNRTVPRTIVCSCGARVSKKRLQLSLVTADWRPRARRSAWRPSTRGLCLGGVIGDGRHMMRPDDLEQRLQARLDALGPLPAPSCSTSSMLPDFDRADRIGEFWSYPERRTFAEPLIQQSGTVVGGVGLAQMALFVNGASSQTLDRFKVQALPS
jgi:hypothetical protein